LGNSGILEVVGKGTVTIVDGSEVSYNDIAEVHEKEPFAITGLQIHILRDGLRYDYANRQFVPVAKEFLLPEI
jgi:cyanophycinase